MRSQLSLELGRQGVLITDGAGGIGTAIPIAFSEVRAKAAIAYYANRWAAEDLVQDLRAKGREAFALSYNMGDYAQATTVVFLSCPLNRNITGELIMITGGGLIMSRRHLGNRFEFHSHKKD